MKLTRSVAFGLAAVLLLQLAVWTQDSDFDPSFYYIFALGSTTLDIDSLIQTASAAGFSVAVFAGSRYDTYREGMPVEATVDEILGDPLSLLADGARFRLRVFEETFAYTVRPGETAFELVLVPAVAVPFVDTLQTVLVALQELGIVGTELSMDFQTYERASIKGPPPPQGVAIDSDLYNLVIAEDWLAEADVRAIELVGLRAVVVAEKADGAEIPAGLTAFVESETETSAKLLMPIELLVLLARSEGIDYVRPPYQPAVP